MTKTTENKSADAVHESEAQGSMDNEQDKGCRQAELFQAIAESPAATHFVADEKRFLYVSPGFEDLTDYVREELYAMGPGAPFSLENGFQIPPAPPCERGDHTESPLHRFQAKITTKNGSEKWVAVTTAPATHELGPCHTQSSCGETRRDPVTVGTAVDITPYKEREETLRRSEMRYRKVFEFAPDAFTIFNTEGEVIDGNPESLKMQGGYFLEEMVGLSMTEKMIEEDGPRFEEIREQTLLHGEWSGELKAYTKDGRLQTVDNRVKVADLGSETVVISISRDITERKHMEEQVRNALKEKEMLLREIHHRVKNNMQIISTLLNLQLRNAGDDTIRALFRESQNRILSMAMIHEKLYQSEGLHKINVSDYVTDLAEEVFISFGEDFERIALKTEIEDIALGMDTAIPCGLIIIELLSNALKYAFPENRKGEVLIGLQNREDGRLELTVSDDGTGLAPDMEIGRLKSLGLRLVFDLALYQLQGEMELLREGGTSVRVRFREREKAGDHV